MKANKDYAINPTFNGIHYLLNGFSFTRTVLRNPNTDIIQNIANESDYIYIAAYAKINEIRWYSSEVKKTPLLYLDKSIEKIFKCFNSTTRNEINKTRKDNNLEFVGPTYHRDDVYLLHYSFENSQGRIPWIKEEIDHCVKFIALYKQEPIAFVGLTINDNIMRVIHINSIRNQIADFPIDKRIIAWSTRRIIYEICKYGINNSMTALDFGVVNLNDPDKVGISKFKMSFCRNIVDTYIYRYSSEEAIDFIRGLRNTKKLYIH